MHPKLSKALFLKHAGRFDPERMKARGWKFNQIEFPIIDCTFSAEGREPIRIRMIADDWDDLPPEIHLLNPEGERLTKLPQGWGGVYNPGPHPKTGFPFICMRGAREYHTHNSHLDDVWENHKTKSGNSLDGLLYQLWQAWKKLKP